MRSLDWSTTPLGPAEKWPQSLRTSLSICLNSRFALLIWWGPDLVMLYNDAYRQIIAGKHPAALGRPGRECWHEIWHVIGPMLKGVQESGQATWSDDLLLLLERHGYSEECYFTFSYSPIVDESGKVGGVFTPVTETTEKVIGARRLRTLRDLADRSAEATGGEEACRIAAETLVSNPQDIPFALIYLLDSGRKNARLVGTSGLGPGTPASPTLVDLTQAPGPASWPLAEVARTGEAQEVHSLEKFGRLPGGAWPIPPPSALVLPITLPGHALPEGLLVAAVSPRKALDQEYRSFFDLIAGQVSRALAEALAYEEKEKRANALAALDRAKTTFFSNVSHEFRTPLTLMMSPLEDLLSLAGPDLASDAREQLVLVHRNGLRLLKLVNTLLDFSRIEAGRTQAVYESTDLAALTVELASVFRSAVERAGLRLLVECPPLPEPVYLDREMWEKIVLNLLSNAFKFTFEGTIEVRLRKAGEAAELSVTDTGMGIPPEEISHLFERFHRVQGVRARTQEGTGIGLALVQELVKLHGGTVRVESAVGQGSRFVVSIPFGRSHLPADRIGGNRALVSTAVGSAPYLEEALRWLPGPKDVFSPPAPPEGASAGSPKEPGEPAVVPLQRPGRRASVLLADDNADMREYLRRLLEERYLVRTVENGGAALAAARESRPDLILTDVMMPGIDGFELLRRLRSDQSTKAIPVILLSARAGEESRIEGLNAGADDYLVKPFSARELMASVAAHLEISRVRREAALREEESRSVLQTSKERLEDLLASISDSFAMLDSQWRFTYVNSKTAELAGLNTEAMLGKVVWEVFPEMASPPFQQELMRAARERSFSRFEHSFRRLNRWLETRVYPSPQGVTLLTADITDRKRAEEANLQLAAIVESSDDAIIGETLDGTITSWNAGAERLFVYRAEEVIGRPVSLLVPPDRPDEISGIFQQIEHGRTIDHFETVRVRKDGQRLHVSLAISPIRDAKGAIIGVSKIARDITDRKRAEDFLRESERRLRLIAEAIPQLVWTWLPDGRVEYTNQRWFAYTGMSAEDIQGEGWTIAVHPDDRSAALEAWSKALAAGTEWSIEHRLRGTDGQYRWFLTRAVPLQGYDGGIIQWFATCTDIEEQKRTQEVLQETDRRKNEFLAILAHELRNPLAPIRNAAQLLRVSGLPSPDLQNAVGMVDRQVQNLTRLVDDLLDVSRITRGKIKLQKEPVDLTVIVSRAVETSRPLIDSRRHELELSLPAEPVIVETDLIRLAQVLSNLLNNAAKYTANGGRIGLTAQREGEQVVFRVRDSGMGIPPAMLQRIFEPFTQVEAALDRCQGGLGIGLTLVRGLVELHGGTVEALSAGAGKGSEFVIRLPFQEEVQPILPSPRPDPSLEDGASRSVLVVDDNVDSAESLSLLLKLKGHQVQLAHTGQEALELAARHHPQVVLLDIGLPGMNGYEVARVLRSRPETEKAQLIALTGFGQEDDRRRAMEAGFDSHLTKPVDLEVLFSMIAGPALV